MLHARPQALLNDLTRGARLRALCLSDADAAQLTEALDADPLNAGGQTARFRGALDGKPAGSEGDEEVARPSVDASAAGRSASDKTPALSDKRDKRGGNRPSQNSLRARKVEWEWCVRQACLFVDSVCVPAIRMRALSLYGLRARPAGPTRGAPPSSEECVATPAPALSPPAARACATRRRRGGRRPR
jgi:hypothetical protein